MDEPGKSIASLLRADLLALAFWGALVALSFWEPQDSRRAIINVAAGTSISAASAPAIYFVILWQWPSFPIETVILGALYFWIGLLGMRLVPMVLSLAARITKGKSQGVGQ